MVGTEKGAISQKENANLLVLLKEAQGKYGYVSEEFIAQMARSLGLPISAVYGVATFYSFLSTRPLGRNFIRVCKSLPCHLNSNEAMVRSIQREIGIGPGETTRDGKFSLGLVNCIGACDQAPAMLVNADLHVSVTPERIRHILESYE